MHPKTSILQLIKNGVLLFVILLFSNLPTILVFGVGLFWIYEGISRGTTYYPLLKQDPIHMAVTTVENRNHRRIFPDYVATGSVSNEASTIEVKIFENQFRRLRPGSKLEVHPLPSGGWLNQAKLDESKPFFSILRLHVTWHFLAGVAMLSVWFGILPYLRKKQKGLPVVSQADSGNA